MEQENFTVLENKAIGRNISMYRKIRGMKAADLAERLGMKEPSYTRYERGETSITIDIVQQIAEALKVDPLMLISTPPSSFLDSGNNSPGAIVGNNNFQAMSDQQTQLLLKLMENVITLNEKLMTLLDKKEK